MANSTILKSGTILVDTSQDKWIVGSPIGAGGFGDIYLVSPNTSQPAVRGDCRFVAKVEGACSGPLFVETNFYLRVGKKDKGKILFMLFLFIIKANFIGTHSYNLFTKWFSWSQITSWYRKVFSFSWVRVGNS